MPILDRETDDTVVDRFCEMLEYHYMNEIEPFWSKNTTAGNLVELAEQGMSWGNPKNHIPMNANGHAELLMYGNAYLGNYEKAITEAEKRIGVVPSLRYTEGAVKSEIDKARSLIRLISTSDNEQMTATFQAWREENCRLFGLKDQMRCIPARSTQE